jgi:hypothetical protein
VLLWEFNLASSTRNQRHAYDKDASEQCAVPKANGAAPLTKVYMADIDSEDYFLLLSAEQLKAMTYAKAQAEFQRTTFVSEEMKAECQAELEVAKRNGYKFKKV